VIWVPERREFSYLRSKHENERSEGQSVEQPHLEFRIANFESRIENRESRIENQESRIENRSPATAINATPTGNAPWKPKSSIAKRKHAMGAWDTAAKTSINPIDASTDISTGKKSEAALPMVAPM
jgi:hypothetical protein